MRSRRMSTASEDVHHCKQAFGFFSLHEERASSPQFYVVSNFSQRARIVIAPFGGVDLGARLVLMVRGRKHARAVGFTSDKNEKLEYFFSGTIPFGRILLVPVEGYVKKQKPDHPFEDYVTLFRGGDKVPGYTYRAEEALEVLFSMLDTDNNGFLSVAEMIIFKHGLGLGNKLSEDEWSDILFGWQEGDLDSSLAQISCSLFKKFISRFCSGEFVFPEENWRRRPYRTRKDDYLQRVFECFGFDKDLLPSRVSRYVIRIYTERNSLSEFWPIPGVVSAEKAVTCVTGALGQRTENRFHRLTLYMLHCTDWFSASIINNSDEQKEVVLEYGGSVGASDRPTREETVQGHGKMVMADARERGFGLRIPLPRPHPCKILLGPFHRGISGSKLILRLFAHSNSERGFNELFNSGPMASDRLHAFDDDNKNEKMPDSGVTESLQVPVKLCQRRKSVNDFRAFCHVFRSRGDGTRSLVRFD